MKLHVGLPNLPNNDVLYRALDDILASHRLTNNGPYVRKLEAAITETLGVKHAVAVCNATIGLQIVAKALGLTGEVIMPAWTFVATAHAMEWIGLKPIFCDVSASHSIMPSRIERLVNDNTSAILGVHLWGNPCLCRTLEFIARLHEVKLFFDAAHAFGCSYTGRRVGNFGDAEVFSLHATKCINSFEGGIITTNDDELADACRRMRNFGFVNFDDVQSFGTNGKMSEIHAAMGLAMLDQFSQVVDANKANFVLYVEYLESLPGIYILKPNAHEDHNYQYVVVEVDQAAAGVSRDAILAYLHENNVIARRYFYPGIHRLPMYVPSRALPMTERLAERVLVLPTGPSVSGNDIERVCSLIKEALCK